jgi:hypothetical protein
MCCVAAVVTLTQLRAHTPSVWMPSAEVEAQEGHYIPLQALTFVWSYSPSNSNGEVNYTPWPLNCQKKTPRTPSAADRIGPRVIQDVAANVEIATRPAAFTAWAILKCTNAWDMTPCSLVDTELWFVGMYYICLQHAEPLALCPCILFSLFNWR